MRIFVTGGSGFIGTHLVPRLASAGHELVCLVRPTSNVVALQRAGVRLVPGDLLDPPTVRAGMEGCDSVAHLAACYELWVPDRRAYHELNVRGTRTVLECALEMGARKVVHVSTAVVWGNATWPITEASPLGARCASEYARSKREGDEIAWELHRQRGLPLVVVHPAAVLGPGDPKPTGRYVRDMVLGHLPAQVATGHSFCFVHVRDVAEVIARALELEGNVGERYIASAENLTFGEFNVLLAEVAGIRLPSLHMPDALAMISARFLTAIANVTKRRPAWGMAADQIDIMLQGFEFDGSKAARELGISYTPVKTALAEEVARLV